MSLFCENGEYRDGRSDEWERYSDFVPLYLLYVVAARMLLSERPMTFTECVRRLKYVAQNGVSLSPRAQFPLVNCDALCTTLLLRADWFLNYVHSLKTL